jgi:pyruvate kinase
MLAETHPILEVNRPRMRKPHRQNTKIVATVGPACSSYEGLLGLAQAGVDVFRLNFSHGSHEDHKKVIDHLNNINREYNLHLSILADLQGPKLRVGIIKDNALPLAEGDVITIVNRKDAAGTKDEIYMSYPGFAQDCKVGERIMMDDGKLVFEVAASNGTDTVKLRTLFGGVLSSKKGVNLPDTDVRQPSMTEKDREDLDFILTQEVHWIALSFVRKAEDITELRQLVEAAGHSAKVMSKIEKPEAMRNLHDIVLASNGIMVARGDLGVELPMEQLPLAQKQIVNMCIKYARPVIVATQMMDSMITNPSPTRAEITDVANAVLDGTDAVMLSAETSVGVHPELVVRSMAKIIAEAEKHYWPQIHSKRPVAQRQASTFLSDVICLNAAVVAEEIGAKGIVGFTVSGYTAFRVSSFRPKCPIFIFSDSHKALCSFSLVWGVECFFYDKFNTTDETVEDSAEILKSSGFVTKGDLIVNTGSMPIDKRLRTNMLKVTEID